jgi:hypothetical protein
VAVKESNPEIARKAAANIYEQRDELVLALENMLLALREENYLSLESAKAEREAEAVLAKARTR